jgi:AraC-like DNA-binding protein
MFTDQLSAVFDLIEVRNVVSGGFAIRGRWFTRYEFTKPLKLVAMVRGRARLTADGLDGSIDLEAGDVAILNNRQWEALEGDSGEGPRVEFTVRESEPFVQIDGADWADADVIVGGNVDVNPAGEALLTAALPAIGHVRASAAEASSLHEILNRLVDEVTGNRIGAAFAIRQQGQLMLLEVLRAYLVQSTELAPGWLRVLTDDRLRPALQVMHAEPGKPWRLDELARASAMSRTTFAERFRTLAGVPPLTYLNSWRMLLAQRALRDGDTRVGTLAFELGYTSESAFSNAFKREVGMSPMRYRASVRAELSVARSPTPLRERDGVVGRPGPADAAQRHAVR